MATNPAYETECAQFAYALNDEQTYNKFEPSDISAFGGTNTLTAPNKIDGSRQRSGGRITERTASFSFTGPMSISGVWDFIVPAMYFDPARVARGSIAVLKPTAVTTQGYTVVLTAAQRGLLKDNSLIYVTGSNDPRNNGLKALDTDATANNISVHGTTFADANASNLQITAVGYAVQSADATSWTWNSSAKTGTLVTSSSSGLNGVGLQPGQTVHFGVNFEGQTQVANGLDSGTDAQKFGYAVFDSVNSTGTAYVFKEVAPEMQSNQNTIGNNVEIFFTDSVGDPEGCRDPDFKTTRFQIQEHLVNDDSTSPDANLYNYVTDAQINTMTLELNASSLANVSVEMIGRNAEAGVSVKTGGDSVIDPEFPTVISAADDFARFGVIDLDESEVSTAVDSITIAINNNASPRNRAGRLEAYKINTGEFQVDKTIQAILTDKELLDRVESSKPTQSRLVVKSSDGVMAFRFPSVIWGDGTKTYTRDDIITVNGVGQANADIGGVTMFVSRILAPIQTVEEF